MSSSMQTLKSRWKTAKPAAIGSWALSADERKKAAFVVRRQREQNRITTILQRKHEAILDKERKLNAREKQLEQQGVTMIGRSNNAVGTPLG